MSFIDIFPWLIFGFVSFMMLIGIPIIVHGKIVFKNNDFYEYLLINKNNFARNNLCFAIPMEGHGFIMKPLPTMQLLFPYAIVSNKSQNIEGCLIFRGTKLHKLIKEIDESAKMSYQDKYTEIIENRFYNKLDE